METFSTTCRPETYRTIVSIALQNKWKIHQYDVTNAFVHAEIDKEIYVDLPTGYNIIMNKEHDNNKVCRLNIALYGLKQSPRLWYKHLLSILKKHNLQAILMMRDALLILRKDVSSSLVVTNATSVRTIQRYVLLLMHVTKHMTVPCLPS